MMIDEYEYASRLFGSSRAEERAGTIGTTVMYGKAVADSSDGSVLVEMDGEVVMPDDAENQYVELPTSPAVQEGDTVMITLTGGTAKAPMVTAVAASGDRIAEAAAAAQDAVTSDDAYYLLSANVPAAPTDETWEQAGWSKTEPLWSQTDTRTLYASRRIEQVDGTVTWSAPAEVSANASLDVLRNAIRAEAAAEYATKYEAADGNRIDPETIVTGYIQSDGTIASQTSAKEVSTGFIAVEPGQVLSLSAYLDETPPTYRMWLAYCFYDAEQAKVGSHVAKYGETDVDLRLSYDSITVPEGAAFIRCSWRSYGVANHAALVRNVDATYATKAALAVQTDRITAEVAARTQTDANVTALSSQVTQTASDVTTLFTTSVADTQTVYYAGASATPPAAPSGHVTSTSTAGGVWTTKQPVYTAANPYYFTCTEYKRRVWDSTDEQYTDDYTFGPVVYDAALTQSLMNADAAQSTADAIKVGGSNLLRDSWRFLQADLVSTRASLPEPGLLKLTPTASASYHRFKMDYLPFDKYGDGYFTLSCEARIADDESSYTSSNIIMYIGFMTAERCTASSLLATASDAFRSQTFAVESTEWTRFSATFKVPDDMISGQASVLTSGSFMVVQFGEAGSKRPILIRRPQLERGNVASEWSATKEETEAIAAAAGSPNLFPYFSDYHPLSGTNNWWYWQSLNATAGVFTHTGDGWCHFGDTATAVQTRYWSTAPQEFVEPDTYYTVLMEVKNLVITGSGLVRLRAVSPNANAQFPTLGANIDLNNEGEGVYRFLVKSGASVSGKTIMMVSYVTAAADTVASFDFRVSLYKGDYQGDYKPYVFPQYETGPNLFEVGALELGYLNGDGTVHAPAASGADSSCAVTDYIPVESGVFYALSIDTDETMASASWDRCIFYDANKESLGSLSYHGVGASASVRGNFLAPANAAYVRISARWLITTTAYPETHCKVKFAKGRFCSDWTPSQADSEIWQTMIRQFSGGELIGRVGNPVGALVNADGSFDVVSLTWSNGEPTITGTLNTMYTDGQRIYDGNGNVVAEFGRTAIRLGSNSSSSAIYFCDDRGQLSFDASVPTNAILSLEGKQWDSGTASYSSGVELRNRNAADDLESHVRITPYDTIEIAQVDSYSGTPEIINSIQMLTLPTYGSTIALYSNALQFHYPNGTVFPITTADLIELLESTVEVQTITVSTGVTLQVWGHYCVLNISRQVNLSGSWTSVNVGTIAAEYRPLAEARAAVIADNNGGLTALLTVATDGAVTVGGRGGAALGNQYMLGQVAYMR